MAELFATCARGVEPTLDGELSALGALERRIETGGVRFDGDARLFMRANLWLRTAIRVVRPLLRFRARTPDELYEAIRTLDWRDHLTAAMTLAIDCNARGSVFTHSRYAAQKAKDAIVDQLRERTGARPDVDPKDPDLKLNLHIAEDECALGLDGSGDSLHKRGYRVAQVHAPLNEALAAAILLMAGYDGTRPLVDPMCGSGTFAIEAALIATDRAPGLSRRRFGFERWLSFDAAAWKELKAEALARARAAAAAPIAASDASEKAVAAARENARAASVEGVVAIERRPLADLSPPPGPGLLVVNPPYGERLGDEAELEPLYAQLGDCLKQRCQGYEAYVFTGNPRLAKRIGLHPSRKVPLWNGPIECRLLRYEVYAGTRRLHRQRDQG